MNQELRKVLAGQLTSAPHSRSPLAVVAGSEGGVFSHVFGGMELCRVTVIPLPLLPMVSSSGASSQGLSFPQHGSPRVAELPSYRACGFQESKTAAACHYKVQTMNWLAEFLPKSIAQSCHRACPDSRGKEIDPTSGREECQKLWSQWTKWEPSEYCFVNLSTPIYGWRSWGWGKWLSKATQLVTGSTWSDFKSKSILIQTMTPFHFCATSSKCTVYATLCF